METAGEVSPSPCCERQHETICCNRSAVCRRRCETNPNLRRSGERRASDEAIQDIRRNALGDGAVSRAWKAFTRISRAGGEEESQPLPDQRKGYREAANQKEASLLSLNHATRNKAPAVLHPRNEDAHRDEARAVAPGAELELGSRPNDQCLRKELVLGLSDDADLEGGCSVCFSDAQGQGVEDAGVFSEKGLHSINTHIPLYGTHRMLTRPCTAPASAT